MVLTQQETLCSSLHKLPAHVTLGMHMTFALSKAYHRPTKNVVKQTRTVVLATCASINTWSVSLALQELRLPGFWTA